MKCLWFSLGIAVTSCLAAQPGEHHWPSGQDSTSNGKWSEWDRQTVPERGASQPVPAGLGDPGDLETYSDLAAFLAAVDDLGEVKHEDFESPLLAPGQVKPCYTPVNRESDDACFLPGQLVDGFDMRVSLGNVTSDRVALLSPNILGTPSVVIGADEGNNPSNPTRIDFKPAPTAVAMDVYDGMQASPVVVSVYAEDDTLIGTLTAEPAATNDPVFVGLTSPVPVGRVELVATAAGSAELLGNLRFAGGAGQLAVAPAALNFGAQVPGDDSLENLELQNTGYLDLEIGSITVPGGAFALASDPCSQSTLAPGESCTVEVVFSPAGEGPSRSELAIPTDNSGMPAQISLAGRGEWPGLAAQPSAIDFGAVAAGNTATETLVLTNRTAQSVTTADLTGLTGPFQPTGGDCGAMPFVLAPGDSCSLEVSFSPDSAGEHAATAALVNGAAIELTRIQLTGLAPGE